MAKARKNIQTPEGRGEKMMLIHRFVSCFRQAGSIYKAFSGIASINQYQLSWLIFIGLVVMISACQE
jgi:hypothetical protein